MDNQDLESIVASCGLDVPVDPTPKFFALIIGINDYPEIKPLQGAVSDAKSMAKYLGELLIPSEHITEIYNEKATRAAIITGLQQLANDERISKGDAILIFYAGHGCEADAPAGWETDGQRVQGLVPFDVKTLDSTGNVIELLPDRTIASLLDDIAERKGDNITVIFDCCHSTGGTRVDGENPNILARLVEAKDLPPISPDLDKYIIRQSGASSRASITPASFAHRALRSHVLLAACGSTEVAWERDGQGEFTSALLSTLKSSDLGTLTYTELMNSLPPMTQQNPQCEGFNKSRALFNSKLAGASPSMTRVEVMDGMIKLHAGFAQGVTKGARFEIYQHHLIDHSNPCLGTLEVTAIQTFHSVLGSSDALPVLRNPAYARQVGTGSGHHIQVYVSPELHDQLKGDPEWQSQFLSDDSQLGVRPTSSQLESDLSLDVTSDNQVTFHTHNKLANEYGINQLPHTVPLDAKRVLDVLRSAAAWNWHISRTNPRLPFGNNVRIEVFRVKEELTTWNEFGRRPLVKDGENLNASGIVSIVADASHFYGYRIVNDSNIDLYPYLFYFDASKLSIEPYYLGPIPGAGKIDIPLRRKNYLSIGYGASGVVPFAYCLDDDQRLDVGIIKLFVATSPVHFGLIEQNSPFEEGGRGNQRKVTVQSRLANVELWDTQIMVLAQYDQLPNPINPQHSPKPEAIQAPALTDLDSKALSAPLPVILLNAHQPKNNLSGNYGLGVVFLITLMLSCVPFIIFYLFVLP